MTPIVITVGEPAGIGPDCILRSWQHEAAQFHGSVIAAPASWIEQRATAIGINVNCRQYSQLDQAVDAAAADESSLHCWNPVAPDYTEQEITAGTPSAATAATVVGCIEAAALACLQQKASALVTGPIEKAILRSCGFRFPGHTEFLAHLAGQHTGVGDKGADFVMMLASEHIRVALLTTHMALRDVPDSLNIHDTLRCLQITHHDLHQRFGINTPRLALCGLNPHAGEQGHFGREEIDILAPAVTQAREAGISVDGPLSADTLFSQRVRDNYDAIVCCYHDQALIPLKTLSFGEAVNITLGLPFIRTSVDHGTALDRAGKEDVSYTSLVAAMSMARQMSLSGG